jgi:hypothetical protein
MIVLDATTKSLEVKLAGAITTTELDWSVAYVDTLNADQSISTISSGQGVTTGGTAVSMVAAPASGHTRIIKSIAVKNRDTVDATVTIQVNVSGTKTIEVAVTLSTLDQLIYEGA